MRAISNFSFLDVHDATLAKYCEQAEGYFHDDPSTAIAKLRLFAERLAKLVSAQHAICLDETVTFEEQLRRLTYGRVLPRQAADKFHALRKLGNVAVHEGRGTYSEALEALEFAHQLGVWFHRSFGKDPNFAPSPFVPPPPPVDGTAALKEELAALRRVVAEKEGAKETAKREAQEQVRVRNSFEPRSDGDAGANSVEMRALSEGDAGLSQADRIRLFAMKQWVEPARAKGLSETTIRAGDVHRKVGLVSAMPAVCSALRGGKFAALARAALGKVVGPANGANVYFHFNLSPLEGPSQHGTFPTEPTRVASTDLDLQDALVLVSCVKSKLPHAAAARDLYVSAWFCKARNLVETSGARWFVLSSRYGLVAPDARIEPYDYTLNTLGVAERREWA